MTQLPDTMQAVALTGHGDLDMLQYGDYPVPEVTADEVLLEVHACGMNNTDVWVRQGAYGTDDDPDAVASWRRGKPTLEFPRIQGADTVGKIVALGKDIDPSRLGERVIVDFSIYNTETAKIKPSLFATYPLSEFHRAQTDFMAKGYIGKLVVMPDRFFQPV